MGVDKWAIRLNSLEESVHLGFSNGQCGGRRECNSLTYHNLYLYS